MILVAGCAGSGVGDDGDDTGGVNPDPTYDGRIVISTSQSPQTVITRGSGTVGGLMEDSTMVVPNQWRGEKVHVIMTRKESLELAREDLAEGNTGGDVLFGGTTFDTPTGSETGLAQAEDGRLRYYPMTGQYQFYGYYTDDAANEALLRIADDGSYYYVPFTIDGTQDLMTAATVAPDSAKLGSEGTAGRSNFYSSYAARRGVHPNLRFSHKLTRLQFFLQPWSEKDTLMQVTDIAIESHATGKLVVAGHPAYPEIRQRAWFDDAGFSLFNVKRRVNGLLTGTLDQYPVWVGDSGLVTPIGEAILLEPRQRYKLTIGFRQPPVTDDPHYTAAEVRQKWEAELSLPNSMPFQEGCSYKVIIKVYRLVPIELQTTIINWKDGGEIDMDPDK
jgi:hypothetical protein